MGYEMSRDFHERTRLMAVAQFLGQWAWVIAPWFWPLLYNQNLFSSAADGHGARAKARRRTAARRAKGIRLLGTDTLQFRQIAARAFARSAADYVSICALCSPPE